MVNTSPIHLPWNFEAFREYLSFEVLQAAASVLLRYDGEDFDIRNPLIIRMQKEIIERTGKNSWVPSRSGVEGIEYNNEGDLYRNKGRLLTSLFIIEPKEATGGLLKMQAFGRNLGKGLITEEEFYRFIISRYRYPHPAYRDNWNAWNAANKSLYPFLYILAILLKLHEIEPLESKISSSDIADYFFYDPDMHKIEENCLKIISGRRSNEARKVPRTDEIHRKINDLIGFLCLSKFCYYRVGGESVSLNLIDLHREEKVLFEIKRDAQDRYKQIQELVGLMSNQKMQG